MLALSFSPCWNIQSILTFYFYIIMKSMIDFLSHYQNSNALPALPLLPLSPPCLATLSTGPPSFLLCVHCSWGSGWGFNGYIHVSTVPGLNATTVTDSASGVCGMYSVSALARQTVCTQPLASHVSTCVLSCRD